MNQQIKDFIERNKQAELGGGQEKIDKQKKAGKLTARERINVLLDKGTFVELDKFVIHQSHNLGMESFPVTERLMAVLFMFMRMILPCLVAR